MTPHILVYTKCPTLYIKAAFTYSKINRTPGFQGLATGKSAIFTASRILACRSYLRLRKGLPSLYSILVYY
jgi:hypothetical protein